MPETNKIIIFLRHGEALTNVTYTTSNDPDKYPLTENGRAMAERAATKLEGLHIDGFYTSPVLRARETAGIVAKHIGMKPEVSPMLVERGFGKYNGRQFKSRSDIIIEEWRQIEEGYPDYESWSDIMHRVNSFVANASGGTILAVTHSDVISGMLGSILKRDEMALSGISPIYGSFTILDLSKKGFDCVVEIGSPNIPKLHFKHKG